MMDFLVEEASIPKIILLAIIALVVLAMIFTLLTILCKWLIPIVLIGGFAYIAIKVFLL